MTTKVIQMHNPLNRLQDNKKHTNYVTCKPNYQLMTVVFLNPHLLTNTHTHDK